jgi:hypothetical protein
MKVLFLVAVIAVASANAKAAIKEAGDTSRPAPWYNCSGKQPGNYINPRDCTRFITCDAGLQAIEFDCGECSNRPEACTPQNRLVYNATVDQCLWADETECVGESEPTTTTTEVTSESTTEASAAPSPTTPEDSTQPPKEGDPCDPENCRNSGECQTYLRCDKETEKLVADQCGDGMFWNPNNGAIHGGNCDLLENLSNEVRDRYRSDPECLACFWRQVDDCSQDYLYQAPNQNNRNVSRLSCSNGLVFSEEKETCQRCQDVKRSNGTNCC